MSTPGRCTSPSAPFHGRPLSHGVGQAHDAWWSGSRADQRLGAVPLKEQTAHGSALLRDLDTDRRFHRDRGLGRILHPGAASYRETVAENSLHLIVDGGRISAHVDRFSPLGLRAGSARYPVRRVALHNLFGMATDAARLLTRRAGKPSCVRVEVDDALIRAMSHARAERRSSVEEVLDRRRVAAGSTSGEHRTPFTVVDEAVLLLDSPEQPWSVELEARLRGTLDEARLRAAAGRALLRHPMGRARMAASSRGTSRDHWELTSALDVDPVEVIDCPDDGALEAARSRLQSLQVPLSTSPPVRVRLARHPDGDVLMVNAHHAAMDGFGALRIMRSIARAYAGDPDPLPAGDCTAGRSLTERRSVVRPSVRVRRFFALLERARDLLVPPARLAAHQGRQRPGYGLHHARLDSTHTAGLLDRRREGSVNDVLVAALHLAVARWNARQGAPCRRVSVLVPANLRPPRRREEGVGNVSLPARITTTRRQRRSPATTLAAVTARTARKKRSGMGTALLEALRRTRMVPLWAKRAALELWPAATDRFVDTAILSNLGSVEEAPSFGADGGDTVGMAFSAPARMPLGLSVGAVTVAGRLHLSFRYRHPQLGPDAAREFASCYLEALERVALAA